MGKEENPKKELKCEKSNATRIKHRTEKAGICFLSAVMLFFCGLYPEYLMVNERVI